MRISDWSSDVCSSDLGSGRAACQESAGALAARHERCRNFRQLPQRNIPAAAGEKPTLPRLSAGKVVGSSDNFPNRRRNRSEERRVGNEGVITCISRWLPDPIIKKKSFQWSSII